MSSHYTDLIAVYNLRTDLVLILDGTLADNMPTIVDCFWWGLPARHHQFRYLTVPTTYCYNYFLLIHLFLTVTFLTFMPISYCYTYFLLLYLFLTLMHISQCSTVTNFETFIDWMIALWHISTSGYIAP